MAKDTYYFSHDYNPIGDPKMQAMTSKHGGLGYGIFWRIVEMLHSESDHCLPIKRFLFVAVADQMKTTPDFVEGFINDCIDEFELFLKQTKQNNSASFFTSSRVIRNIQNKNDKKEKKSDSGRKGGIASGESRRKKIVSKQNEAVLQPNEPNEAKESKVKESINNNKNIPDIGFRGFAPIPLFYPKKENFNGLPESTKESLKRLLKSVKQIEVDDEQLNAIWETFKDQNLIGSKEYKDENDVYRHFVNWGAKQSFRKKTTKRDRVNLKSYEIFGVEFINAFSQCRMTNGDIVDLTRNEKDMATYGQIKPSSIKRD